MSDPSLGPISRILLTPASINRCLKVVGRWLGPGRTVLVLPCVHSCWIQATQLVFGDLLTFPDPQCNGVFSGSPGKIREAGSERRSQGLGCHTGTDCRFKPLKPFTIQAKPSHGAAWCAGHWRGCGGGGSPTTSYTSRYKLKMQGPRVGVPEACCLQYQGSISPIQGASQARTWCSMVRRALEWVRWWWDPPSGYPLTGLSSWGVSAPPTVWPANLPPRSA